MYPTTNSLGEAYGKELLLRTHLFPLPYNEVRIIAGYNKYSSVSCSLHSPRAAFCQPRLGWLSASLIRPTLLSWTASSSPHA